MTKAQMPDPSDEPLLEAASLVAAGQQAALDILRVEMSALSTLMQGLAPANAEDRGRRAVSGPSHKPAQTTDAEADFDNMPI